MSQKLSVEGQRFSTEGLCSPRSIRLHECLLDAKAGALIEIRYMLGLQRLTFADDGLEACFRSHWAASSRTLLNLLSLLTLVIWSVATYNVHTHCKWSQFLCHTLEVVCACAVVCHACIQYQLRKHPMWHVEEVNKAYVYLVDLAGAMVHILLLENLEEVPGCTHDWMYSCHGWAILFLQVTTVSAFHLHLLNLMAYCIVEAFLAHEFGWNAFARLGARHIVAVVALCGVLPLGVNATIEMQSRREFLRRNRSHPIARREWLCPS